VGSEMCIRDSRIRVCQVVEKIRGHYGFGVL
jgi:hypothetical protein